MPDVEMESVESCKYDPDDLDLEGRLAQMANATLGQATHIIPRIKLSATTDLKEFHGRDDDED